MKDKFDSVEKLLSDPGFRNWVLNPDPLSDRYWQSILSESPQHKDAILEARLIVHELSNQNISFNSEDEAVLWERIQSSVQELSDENKIIDINRQKPSTYNIGYTSSKNYFSRYWYYAAAMVVGLLVVVTVALQGHIGIKENKKVATREIEKVVPKGQKLKMHLPDGSKVAMNASSKITYLKDFSDEKRVVEIAGEVFFDVKKDSAHPFIVKCQGLKTEVLGTSFNVKAYENSGNITVSLLEGSVKIYSSGNKDLTLEPGEEVILNKQTGKIIKSKIDHLNKLRWMDGILAFKNESIESVFEKLEQWYGVDFIVDEIPRDKVLTGKFENEYLDNVLQSINYTVKFDFEISGDTVHVKFKK